ncbi:SPOR domain-containing protein [Candidatus Parabeggiatoa sp. HSG14]|uniref:SPOR domain-containing protein n=1 Tax=Candidatus Parabeggiatoa sp. HSG14 TaxID=3055593 RepID=UPI0025A770E7|nr:SPOR domain-containing protein [Thiotrichales bacterium HSG14]
MHNIRRSITESYDPKQRIVGGVVLFLLMLFIYSLLKLVLGFSSDIDTSPLPPLTSQKSGELDGNNSLLDEAVHPQKKLTLNQRRLLPRGFVFLDLKGKPMHPELPVPNEEPEKPTIFESNGEERWFVQAASLKTEDQAQRLVQRIKNKGIAEEVHIIQTSDKKWYVVRLSPQNKYSIAKQQYRQLRTSLRVKGMIKKID